MIPNGDADEDALDDVTVDIACGDYDSKSGEALMQLFNELHAGSATVCIVTHDPSSETLVQAHLSLRRPDCPDSELTITHAVNGGGGT